HWSAGLVGYFPTYTLGNLYAAQLMEAMQRELGEHDPLIAKGEFQPLLSWLRGTIHEHGACYHPVKLIENACARPLDARPLVKYLRGKLTPIYEM
ncbi:MAG: carboxypeptidase M32, partial [Planctomycetales bacterium]|nr:carboxypeptidase M32 [Planctomycetales bacterium]